MHALFLYLHLVCAVIWIGGMFFAHFCLRPAAMALEPAQRFGLWRGVLGSFFRYVSVAIIVLLVTGAMLFSYVEPSNAPTGWKVMALLGIIMMAIYGHIRFAGFTRYCRAADEADWTGAAFALGSIRRLVIVNLALGFVVIGAAIWH